MYFRCPACHKHSIFFLTKLIFLGNSKLGSRRGVNTFSCTSCQEELKCYYNPLSMLLIGVLVGITCYSITEGGYDLTSPFPLFFAIAALFTYPILRKANDSFTGMLSGHIRTFGLALALVLASVIIKLLRYGV